MPTVILGSAIDIVETCGAPRFVFTDFPLGNPCGRPYDARRQRGIVATGIEMLETAIRPGAVKRTPYRWSEDESRRRLCMQVRAQDARELAAMGAARRVPRPRLREGASR